MIDFKREISISAAASCVGGLEEKGPLCQNFDAVCRDSKFEKDTWEKAESEMIRQTILCLVKKAKLHPDSIDFLLGGDLTNQCAATSFGVSSFGVPHLGLYGACSTFALGLALGAILIEANCAENCIALSSSHYCTAERQYRYPLEYGCQRTPTAQTTVTGAGACILSSKKHKRPRIRSFLGGIIQDCGIYDANNMGAAMAPAAADTLIRFFREKSFSFNQNSAVVTGDLGVEGYSLFEKLCSDHGIVLPQKSGDCGRMIFDPTNSKLSAGGSGAGCSSCVFSAYWYPKLCSGEISELILIGTGALLSPASVLQNESIPAIAHLVRITSEG